LRGSGELLRDDKVEDCESLLEWLRGIDGNVMALFDFLCVCEWLVRYEVEDCEPILEWLRGIDGNVMSLFDFLCFCEWLVRYVGGRTVE
jgi:hypothetical protein